MGKVSEVSLVVGLVPVAALVGGLIALVLLLVPAPDAGPTWWTRRVPAAVAAGVGLAVGVGVVTAGAWQPFSNEPWIATAGTAVVLTGVTLAVLRRGSGPVPAIPVTLVVVLTVCVGVQVNAVVGTYPTLGSALGVGTAIALNTRRRLYRYPEERPLVG